MTSDEKKKLVEQLTIKTLMNKQEAQKWELSVWLREVFKKQQSQNEKSSKN